MGKKTKIISDQNGVWHSHGCTKFFEDFAITFAYAFRYYITGLIIGYFLCVTFKKFYSAWKSEIIFRRRSATQPEDSHESYRHQEDLDENRQQKEDGNQRQSRKGNSSNSVRQESASCNIESFPSMRESNSAINYWKQCFDNFGFVVVDSLHPVVPFKGLSDAGNSNGPQRSPMTLPWEPNLDHVRDVPGTPITSRSSSTTDIKKYTSKTIAKGSQVKSGEFKYKQDSCVDTRDLENSQKPKKATKKSRNRRLDTSELENVGINESTKDTSQNEEGSIVKKNQSAPDLKDTTVKSSLIPGQKVSKNAVIVLRLKDKHLSTCNVFDEDEAPLTSMKALEFENRKRIKKPSYYRMSSDRRKHREASKSRRHSEQIITSDEGSLESFEDHRKSRNLLSVTKPSKNDLQCPFIKKRHMISDEKHRNKTGSKNRSRHSNEVWERRNVQSQARQSSRQIRLKKADKILQSQDFSKRSCFKYKKPSRKRQKISENHSKLDIKSLTRFFSDLRKSNPSTTKQSNTPTLWATNYPSNDEDIYQIEVKECGNGLRIRSKSKCKFSETPTISDRVRKGIESFRSKERGHRSEPPLRSRSRHRISETKHHPENDSEELCHIEKRFGSSKVSIGISNKQGGSIRDRKSKEVVVTNFSDISTGSESISTDDMNYQLAEKRKRDMERENVDELIVAVSESCNKIGRGQFWKIFGSKNNGK